MIYFCRHSVNLTRCNNTTTELIEKVKVATEEEVMSAIECDANKVALKACIIHNTNVAEISINKYFRQDWILEI